LDLVNWEWIHFKPTKASGELGPNRSVGGVKTTPYFESLRARPDRVGIREEWIELAIRRPDKESIQRDGRIRRWARISEAGGRYLRVVLLPDGETVHNAFFDRRFVS
jgi:hypothetical protein